MKYSENLSKFFFLNFLTFIDFKKMLLNKLLWRILGRKYKYIIILFILYIHYHYMMIWWNDFDEMVCYNILLNLYKVFKLKKFLIFL